MKKRKKKRKREEINGATLSALEKAFTFLRPISFHPYNEHRPSTGEAVVVTGRVLFHDIYDGITTKVVDVDKVFGGGICMNLNGPSLFSVIARLHSLFFISLFWSKMNVFSKLASIVFLCATSITVQVVKTVCYIRAKNISIVIPKSASHYIIGRFIQFVCLSVRLSFE